MALQVENLHLALNCIAADVALLDAVRKEVDPVDHLHAAEVRRNDELTHLGRDVLDGKSERNALLMIQLHRFRTELVENLIPEY